MKTSLLLTFSLLICLAAMAQSGSQIFTSSGTFTVPDGINLVTIEVIGAGGEGGGNGGGGGGGGGYAKGNYTVTPLTILTVTIGEPNGGAATGKTSVDALISATGGANGNSVSNPNIGGGGAGGIGTGGTIANYTGGNGGGGYWTYFGGGGGGAAGTVGNGGIGGNTIVWNGSNCNTPGGSGGISGGAPAGNGGKGAGFIDNFCSESNPAEDGESYGAGGGGGNGNGGPAKSGSGGYCKITYCVLDVAVQQTDVTITTTNVFSNYQWIDCANGNTAIAGATNQSYTATQNGSYAVVVSDEFCSDTSACVDVVSTGIQPLVSANGVIVYPTNFTDKVKTINTIGNEWYELTTTTGQLIWQGRYVETQDFSGLTTGWYLLKIKNSASEQVIRLHKQ
jgi:hypothetical protein